jgi:hypothetical protein
MDPRADRSNWAAGEWDGEPDKVQWVDEATGLVCLAKRSPHLGHWCGYVGLLPTHPWHGKDYGDSVGQCGDSCSSAGEEHSYHYECTVGALLEVHGGVTYADGCQDGPIEQTVCHLPAPGSPDHLWWIGFDCAHCDDLSPGRLMLAPSLYDHGTYRSLDYVRSECTSLAAQLAAAGRQA